MHHYTYLLEFENGMKYIGVHSTVIEPELDTRYLGSGRKLPPRTPDTCVKTILDKYSSRAHATAAEKALITAHGCCESPEYYNIRKTSPDLHGYTKESCAGIARAAAKLRGRKVDVPLTSATRYKGKDRTPAQKAGALRMAKTLTGVSNPAKGRSGAANNGFAPWYFITPDGQYQEVHDMTKQAFAKQYGHSPQSIVNRCRPGAAHVRAHCGKWKGWVFGPLPQ